MLSKWKSLPPAARQAFVILGGLDAALRFVALRDLNSRAPEEVAGSRKAWKIGLTVINSMGILPAAYYLRGRKPRVAADA